MKPSQDRFTWVHALKPAYSHMFQSYARGAKEQRSIEEYLEVENRSSEVRSICSQVFAPFETVLRQAAGGGVIQPPLSITISFVILQSSRQFLRRF